MVWNKNRRDPFWKGYKELIRRYGGRDGSNAQGMKEHEREAVRAAVSLTEGLEDGEERIKLIDLVFWKKTHTLSGASVDLHISERTARRWHTEFIKLVAKNIWKID